MTSVWESYWSNQDNWDWWKKPAPEVLDLIRSLSPSERPKILDLGCGLGRHAIAFAMAEFSVTATDASATAIQHLTEWAHRLRLPIEARVCEMLTDTLPTESFDVVLSYNVIYHGSREQFAQAIQQARKLLKRNGIFFFTCPSRQDGKYGFGERVAPHTYRCAKSVTPGDIHYFADEDDLKELLDGFQTIARWKSEGYWDNQGEQQFFSNWHVRAEKSRERDSPLMDYDLSSLQQRSNAARRPAWQNGRLADRAQPGSTCWWRRAITVLGRTT